MANYNIQMQRWNGSSYDALYPRNILYGTSAPTTSTIGVVGQQYVWTTALPAPIVYVCAAVSGSTYTWSTGVPYTNSNLLDNWDFHNPINTRGQTTYTPTGSGTNWSIDGWSQWDTTDTLTINSGYITLSKTASWISLYQLIANASQYAGLTVTFSANVKASSGVFQLRLIKNKSTTLQSIQFSSGTSGIVSLTMTLPTDLTSTDTLGVAFYLVSGDTLDLYAAKLEIGSVSTLANDAPANYGEELAKCVGAPTSIGGRGGFTVIATGTYIGTGTYGSSNPIVINTTFIPKQIIVTENGITNTTANNKVFTENKLVFINGKTNYVSLYTVNCRYNTDFSSQTIPVNSPITVTFSKASSFYFNPSYWVNSQILVPTGDTAVISSFIDVGDTATAAAMQMNTLNKTYTWVAIG